MKKLFVFLTVAGMLTFGLSTIVSAQVDAEEVVTEVTDPIVEEAEPAPAEAMQGTLEADYGDKKFHYILKEKFIEGGAGFMSVILLCLIIGLGLAIERIIYLNLAHTNTTKLLNKVEDALKTGGVQAAKEVCKTTRGPVASIYYQGLDRYDEGMEIVEKSIVSYGGVQMGRLEMNLSWISLFIAIAPMLGFMGTVIGMIGAFDAIAAAGDISPTIVADGIKVALLTTVFGLIVAVILQVFYNYIVSKIDSIVNSMEDSAISFMDLLIKYKK
ncbi:MAG: MotA/TolQ/ExbB proton channel family protein [Bacteroidales bacterium]|jgi:biopolymer transport protein ExbB|nr:MotA/TolQ/ExbB proton channel family protein [Bacteroidales bacterium]